MLLGMITYYQRLYQKHFLGNSSFIQQKLSIFDEKVSQKLAKKRLTLSKNTSEKVYKKE
jgi:hypothetical protein